MQEIENPSNVSYNQRQKEVLEIYSDLNSKNSHKMKSIPIFKKQSY